MRLLCAAQEPLAAQVHFSQGGGGAAPSPTCHSHAPDSLDEYDLAVGLSTGEGALSCGWRLPLVQ